MCRVKAAVKVATTNFAFSPVSVKRECSSLRNVNVLDQKAFAFFKFGNDHAFFFVFCFVP